jgi:hypothetical protein
MDTGAGLATHLHRRQRNAMLLHVQPMEIIGSRPGLAQHVLYRSRVDRANVSTGRDRAAMAQTLEDALERFVGQLGILPQRTAAFAEAFAAMRAVQAANVFAFADPFDDAEIAGIESIESRTILVGARQVCQRVRLAARAS